MISTPTEFQVPTESKQPAPPPMNINVTYGDHAIIKTSNGDLITISTRYDSEQMTNIDLLSTTILIGITVVAMSTIHFIGLPYNFRTGDIYNNFILANRYISPASGALFALGTQQLYSVVSDYCSENKLSVAAKISKLINSACFFTLAGLSYSQVNRMCYGY